VASRALGAQPAPRALVGRPSCSLRLVPEMAPLRSLRRRGAHLAAAGVALATALSALAGARGAAWLQPPNGQPSTTAQSTGTQEGQLVLPGRRAAFAAAGLALPLSTVMPAVAAEPSFTKTARFEVQFGKGNAVKKRKLVIGIYGDEAPILSRSFVHAVENTYPGEAGRQVRYRFADVKSLETDKAITWADFEEGNLYYKAVQEFDSRWIGNKVVKLPLAGDDTITEERNGLRHDLAGRVSMRMGGNSFDFSVTPVANVASLDATNVVIGQVLEGMDVIEDINKMRLVGGKPSKKVRFYSSTLI